MQPLTKAVIDTAATGNLEIDIITIAVVIVPNSKILQRQKMHILL